uniref:Uncharacterized protein n=1 Tax=Aegilops tauschii subsp. strangulata TaxID=200361 RepID=A0A453I8P9_AEGTS
INSSATRASQFLPVPPLSLLPTIHNSKAHPCPGKRRRRVYRFPGAEAMAAAGKFNRSNPAVKRILQEVKEMQSNPSPDFMALPLEVSIPISSPAFTLSFIRSRLFRSESIRWR